MKRLIIALLILILSLTGASCKGTSAGGSIAPDASENAASSPIPPSASNESASAGSTAAEDTSAPPSSSSAPSADKDTIKLEGTIGDIAIHMSLKIEEGTVTGTYYYDKVKQDIRLDGTIEANRMITIKEYDVDGTFTGTFDGWYTPGIRLSGSWTNAKTDEVLSISLDVMDGIPSDAVWAGEWKRTETGRFASAALVIFNETQSSFAFQIDAFYGSHMGFIDGTAIIDGTSAYFKDKQTSAELVFNLKNGLIDVLSKGDIFYYAGANVFFDGSYTHGELPEDTLLAMGYVPDKARDDAFRSMTGEAYELFLNTAQIKVEQEELDGFGAQVFNWWVTSFGGTYESTVMFLPDGKICAAVIDFDGGSFKVYTNADYITAVPKTIEVWVAKLQELLGISDMPVEFHGTHKN